MNDDLCRDLRARIYRKNPVPTPPCMDFTPYPDNLHTESCYKCRRSADEHLLIRALHLLESGVDTDVR